MVSLASELPQIAIYSSSKPEFVANNLRNQVPAHRVWNDYRQGCLIKHNYNKWYHLTAV